MLHPYGWWFKWLTHSLFCPALQESEARELIADLEAFEAKAGQKLKGLASRWELIDKEHPRTKKCTYESCPCDTHKRMCSYELCPDPTGDLPSNKSGKAKNFRVTEFKYCKGKHWGKLFCAACMQAYRTNNTFERKKSTNASKGKSPCPVRGSEDDEDDEEQDVEGEKRKGNGKSRSYPRFPCQVKGCVREAGSKIARGHNIGGKDWSPFVGSYICDVCRT